MTTGAGSAKIIPGLLVVVALSFTSANAADKTKVNEATKRVERGAQQIGRGQVGPGFKEMFTGIGSASPTRADDPHARRRRGRLEAPAAVRIAASPWSTARCATKAAVTSCR